MGSNHDHHYHAIPDTPDSEARFQATRRVTIVGAVVNLLLAIGKTVLGVLGNSQALVADGVHSLSDLVTDAMVLVASKHGSKEADADHPYGHARIETAMTVGLGAVLIVVAAGISIDAVERLFNPEKLLHPGPLALVAALLSVLANEGLFRYTLRVARQVRSNLLKANAWHHRSDALSSVVVIVGVGGTMAGLDYLDAIAAVGVALMVAKIGWDLAWHSLRELVDTGLDPETVEAIRTELKEVDGVHSVHELRTRRMGADALVDVHVLVDPELSVSEGHHISETARARLMGRFDEVQDVLVHIDPEDDEASRPSVGLPSRQSLLDDLGPRWTEILGAGVKVKKVTIHYLDGQIRMELLLPLDVLETHSAESLQSALAASAEGRDEVALVKVYFA